MSLKLRVISDHHKALGRRSSKLFGVTGGRIGRAQDNDWVLPDPDRYVSSHHCKIVFRAGKWILEDTSTNGVFINGSDAPDTWIDITETFDIKCAALKAHASQVGPGEWVEALLREWATRDGKRVGVTYAEAYRRMVLWRQ